jgi:LacI family transcriptional regulator
LINYKSSLFNLNERRRGYIAALKEHNIEIKRSWVKEICFNNSKASVEKIMSELLSLKEPVDAILFSANTLAVDGLKYINKTT